MLWTVALFQLLQLLIKISSQDEVGWFAEKNQICGCSKTNKLSIEPKSLKHLFKSYLYSIYCAQLISLCMRLCMWNASFCV